MDYYLAIKKNEMIKKKKEKKRNIHYLMSFTKTYNCCEMDQLINIFKISESVKTFVDL
jgi:hypothetical protein